MSPYITRHNYLVCVINIFEYIIQLMKELPATTAYVKVLRQSFSEQCINGEVSAGGFEWQFNWAFGKGELSVEPSLGRALIEDALMRFLLRADYNLEAGGDYIFKVRAEF